MYRFIESIITTWVIILFIPLLGFVINKVINLLLKLIAKKTSAKLAIFIHNWLTFVGTIHHELSHALFAFISGAKIVNIDVFKPTNNSLGSVTFIPRGNLILQSIQLTLTAIAPVIMGFISSYILAFNILAICNSIFTKGIIIYLIISILMHSTMSNQDIKNWVKGLPLTMFIIFILVFITGFNFSTVSIFV